MTSRSESSFQQGRPRAFLEYDVASGATLALVFRTILDLALKESLGRHRARGDVYLVLDGSPYCRSSAASMPARFAGALDRASSPGPRTWVRCRRPKGPVWPQHLSGFGSLFAFRLYDEEAVRTSGTVRGHRKLVHYDASLKTRGVGEHCLRVRWSRTGT